MKRVVIGLFLAIVLPALAFPASATVLAQTQYTQTKYPMVLVHGYEGYDQLLGFIDYWFLIPQELRAGGAKVYTLNVSQSHYSAVRGEQVITQLDNLKALYGYQKFNLIGHSHGGPTIRYVASVRPDLVASATSVGSPHHGTKVADVVLNATTNSLARTILIALETALSKTLAFLSGHPGNPQDTMGGITSQSTAGATAFNAQHPQGKPAVWCGQGAASVNGVRYYSIGGTAVFTNALDPMDYGLSISTLAMAGTANDGLVERCSNHWGTVLRDDYPWNHMDEVNQTLGLRGLLAPNPVEFYRSHANRLKNLSL